MTITLKPVKSSNLAAVGYDEDARELHVKFRGGSTWVYSDVDPQAHADLMAAPSHGIHFIENIRGAYKERKL